MSRKLGILLVTLVLVAGVLGCGFERVIQYPIRISSTLGGTVTTPGEGLFYYPQGTVLDLVARPDPGYQFNAWTGNVDTIADAADSTTTITINNNYYIIARFDS